MRFPSLPFRPRLQERITEGKVYRPDAFEVVPPEDPKGPWVFIRKLFPQP